jgi:ABC-type multidrug transport system permease subunit
VEAIRYACLGKAEVSFAICTLITLALAAVFFSWALYLFKIGYKLRT